MPTSTPTSTSDSRVSGQRFIRMFVVTSAGLLALLDFGSLLLAGLLTDWLWSAPADPLGVGWSVHYLLVVAALLASLMLYDEQFGARALRGDHSALVRCYLTRFLLLVGGVLIIGHASGALGTLSPGAVVIWLALSFVLASLGRAVLVSSVRRLTRNGVLTEVVAIIGAGSLADRLTHDLKNRKRAGMHVLGLFDDDRASGQSAVAGTVDDLIEIGKTQHLDWIFVNLPYADEQRLASVVWRLKALAVPIALCPWNVGLGTPYQIIDYVGGALPVTVLVDRPAKRWRAVVQTACEFLPRWVTTLLLLPSALLAIGWTQIRTAWRAVAVGKGKLSCYLDDYDVESFVATAKDFGQRRYGFVVTPNVDHLTRLHEDARFRDSRYAQDASKLTADVAYRMDAYHYQERGKNEIYHVLNADLSLDMVPDRLFLDFGGSRSQAITEVALGDRSFGSSWRGKLDYDFDCGNTGLSYNETPTTSANDRFSGVGLLDPEQPNDYLFRAGSAERYISKRLEWSLNLKWERYDFAVSLSAESK